MTAMRMSMHKREETKEDGRRIIYYTFVPVEETQEAGREKGERKEEKGGHAAE